MEVTLSQKSVQELAYAIVLIQEARSRRKQDDNEFITTKQAAEILKTSTRWVRDNKDKFEHTSLPGNGNTQLRFKKSSIINTLK